MERDSSLTEESTDSEVCKVIWEIFESETEYDMRQTNRTWERFCDWAQGLALGGLFCYYYNRSAVDDLGDILEETEEERNKFTEAQAEEKLTMLIYRELMKGVCS